MGTREKDQPRDLVAGKPGKSAQRRNGSRFVWQGSAISNVGGLTQIRGVPRSGDSVQSMPALGVAARHEVTGHGRAYPRRGMSTSHYLSPSFPRSVVQPPQNYHRQPIKETGCPAPLARPDIRSSSALGSGIIQSRHLFNSQHGSLLATSPTPSSTAPLTRSAPISPTT